MTKTAAEIKTFLATYEIAYRWVELPKWFPYRPGRWRWCRWQLHNEMSRREVKHFLKDAGVRTRGLEALLIEIEREMEGTMNE